MAAHVVCLFIHQCSVKWGKFSSVILVVERQNKEHECVEKEDLFEHENVSLKLWPAFVFKSTNVSVWNAGTRFACEEGCTLVLSFDLPCSIWLFTL